MIAERDHLLDQDDRDQRPVWQSVEVPGSIDRIVLVNPELGYPNKPFRNLMRRTKDDKVLWTAELPKLSFGDLPDSYIDLRCVENDLIATSFYGMRVTIDTTTGAIR